MSEISTSLGKRKAYQGLGLVTMLAICMGVVVVQGAMASVLQGFGLAGIGFIAAMLVAYILAQCNAISFAELSLMFPSAGTLATYTQNALGHFPAIVSVFSGYVVVAMFGLSAELLLVDAVLQQLFPGLPELIVPLGLLAALTVLNIMGMDIFARMQNIFTFAMVLALLCVGVTALTGWGQPVPVEWKNDFNWSLSTVKDGSFFDLIVMALWLMVGIEFICPLIGDIRQPEKNIPRVMFISLTLICLIFITFSLGATHYLSAQSMVELPLPYLDYVQAVFGPYATPIATVMVLTATCSTVNTVLASVSRMLQGMAENGQAFPQMKIISRRYNTPWMAILFVASIILIPFLLLKTDSILTLLIAASTSWLLAYIIAHLNVIVLRWRQPQLHRPFKTPWYPLPQVIGIVGMAYVIVNNSPSPEMTQTVYLWAGAVLAIVSLIALVWVKWVMKKPLFKPEL